MAETANTDPPPMHEILASIRRIITEDAPIGRSAPEPDGGGEGGEDVLELGEEPLSQPASSSLPSAPAQPVPGQSALGETVAPSGLPPSEAGPAVDSSDALLSAQTQAASQRALAMLSGLTIDPDADANTMDGLVREMLRPMLKAWLDAHLPEMVERLVAREVARISGR